MSDPCCDLFCGLCLCFTCCSSFCDPRLGYGCCWGTKKSKWDDDVEMEGVPGYKAPRSFSWRWNFRRNADDDRFVAEVAREARQEPYPSEDSSAPPPNLPSGRNQSGGSVIVTQPLPARAMEHGKRPSTSSQPGEEASKPNIRAAPS